MRFKQLEPSGGKETGFPAAARAVTEGGDLAVLEARACMWIGEPVKILLRLIG
jgi:hypothetical protein